MERGGRIRGAVGRWVNALLEGTHDHYPCYLPGRFGFLSTWTLRLFYSGITVAKEDLETLRSLQDDGIIVYAAKYNTLFEFLFFHTRYQQEKVPYPDLWLDDGVFFCQPLGRLLRILLAYARHLVSDRSLPDPYRADYARRMLEQGHVGFLSMVDRKGFYRRFVKSRTDPLRYLIRTQRALERPIYIVPQLLMFSRNPPRSRQRVVDFFFGSEENPGRLRRLAALFRAPRNTFAEISRPLDLREFCDRPQNRNRTEEYLSFLLRQEITDRINLHRQSIIGPTLKTREELKESILRNERFQSMLAEYARVRIKPVREFHKEADGYLEEIAAKYSTRVILVLSTLVRWLVGTIFDGVDVDMRGMRNLKTAAQRGPLILIPCHKSHVDYLILSVILHMNNMPCPLIAAGKNLSFWPMGALFRSSGAFFIRRTFAGAPLYSKVFSEYIRTLLHEGFNIEFFIEGGRSRSGKLILPKLGLLSILLNAYKDKACRNLHFCPIFIGYDRVMEEGAYLHEVGGGEKKPENLRQILRAGRFLKRRYGRIYVRFADPIDIEDVLRHFDVPFEKMTTREANVVCRNLSHRVINSINAVSVVTPHSLVAAVLLTAVRGSFTATQLFSQVETYLAHLLSQEARLADTLADPAAAVRRVLDNYLDDKFIEREEGGPLDAVPQETRFLVVEGKRPHLEYYTNNCIHFFVPAAFTSLSILARDAFQFAATDLHADYAVLQELFKNEFHYDVDASVELYVRKTLKAFINDAILMPHPTLPETFNVTSVGFRKLRCFAAFLSPYVESYRIVLEVLMRYTSKRLEKKEGPKKTVAMGNRLYRKRKVTRKEALSMVNYENALAYFASHGIRGNENVEKLQPYADIIIRFGKYL